MYELPRKYCSVKNTYQITYRLNTWLCSEIFVKILAFYLLSLYITTTCTLIVFKLCLGLRPRSTSTSFYVVHFKFISRNINPSAHSRQLTTCKHSVFIIYVFILQKSLINKNILKTLCLEHFLFYLRFCIVLMKGSLPFLQYLASHKVGKTHL